VRFNPSFCSFCSLLVLLGSYKNEENVVELEFTLECS